VAVWADQTRAAATSHACDLALIICYRWRACRERLRHRRRPGRRRGRLGPRRIGVPQQCQGRALDSTRLYPVGHHLAPPDRPARRRRAGAHPVECDRRGPRRPTRRMGRTRRRQRLARRPHRPRNRPHRRRGRRCLPRHPGHDRPPRTGAPPGPSHRRSQRHTAELRGRRAQDRPRPDVLTHRTR
jgi:hypothetical protein